MPDQNQPDILEQYKQKLRNEGIDPDADMFEQYNQKQRQNGIDPNLDIFKQHRLKQIRSGIDPDADMFEQYRQQQIQAGVDPNASIFDQLTQQARYNKSKLSDESNPVLNIEPLPGEPLKPKEEVEYIPYKRQLYNFVIAGPFLTYDTRFSDLSQLNQQQDRSSRTRKRGFDIER